LGITSSFLFFLVAALSPGLLVQRGIKVGKSELEEWGLTTRIVNSPLRAIAG